MKAHDAMKTDISAQAAEWLATVTDVTCTDEERQKFVAWLKRSNLHVDEFLRVSTLTQRLTRSELWPRRDLQELITEATSVASSNISALPAQGGESQALRHNARRGEIVRDGANGNKRAGAQHNPALSAVAAPGVRWLEALQIQVARSMAAPRIRVAIAACSVVLIAITALMLLKYDPAGWTGGTYSTAVGELRSITLEDGSVVELNTSSRLRTHFTAQRREVQLLRGEAVFKVAKNPQRPFRVSTGSTEIVAVGTEFNVYAQQTKTVVTVLEGRVRVTDRAPAVRASTEHNAAGRRLELARGEQAVITPHLPIARVRLADSRQVTSWKERRLIFEDTPLFEAASEFARYSSKTIRIEDSPLRDLRVTGVFDATDPASLVQFVEAYSSVNVREDGEGWTLAPL